MRINSFILKHILVCLNLNFLLIGFFFPILPKNNLHFLKLVLLLIVCYNLQTYCSVSKEEYLLLLLQESAALLIHK